MGANVSNSGTSAYDPAVTDLVSQISNRFKRQSAKCSMPPALQKLKASQQNRLLRVKQKIEELRNDSSVKTFEISHALVRFDRKKYNIAVTGASGSGKSSFINAIRGKRKVSNDRQTEGGNYDTLQIIRRHKFANDLCVDIWNLPSPGTDGHPIEKYVDDKFLYVFDCLLILFDQELEDNERLLAIEAEKNQIPHAFILSKADITLINEVEEAGYDIYGTVPQEILDQIKEKIVDEVSEKIGQCLKLASRKISKISLIENSESFNVFVISNKTFYDLVTNQTPSCTIDNKQLIIDEWKLLVYLFLLAEAKDEGKTKIKFLI